MKEDAVHLGEVIFKGLAIDFNPEKDFKQTLLV